MFVIYCKENGCVKLTCTENPTIALKLANGWEEHYAMQEFPNEEMVLLNEYFLTVENGQLVNLGRVSDLEAAGNAFVCDGCPPLFDV